MAAIFSSLFMLALGRINPVSNKVPKTYLLTSGQQNCS